MGIGCLATAWQVIKSCGVTVAFVDGSWNGALLNGTVLSLLTQVLENLIKYSHTESVCQPLLYDDVSKFPIHPSHCSSLIRTIVPVVDSNIALHIDRAESNDFHDVIGCAVFCQCAIGFLAEVTH